jgi:hypothetical protein
MPGEKTSLLAQTPNAMIFCERMAPLDSTLEP